MTRPEQQQESWGLHWRRAIGVVFCCSCLRKRRASKGILVYHGEKRARAGVPLEKENMIQSGNGVRDWIHETQLRLIKDNDMDLGALEKNRSCTLDNPYEEQQGRARGLPSTENVELLGRDVKRSQPVLIQRSSWGRLREEESRASSLPTIPNPFPELCSPSKSPILSNASLGRSPQWESGHHVVKVFSEDDTCRSLEVTAGTTARNVCEILVEKTHALSDESWSLVEFHPHLALERCLEEHESVVEVQATWPMGGESKFIFRKNFAKYALFKNSPSLFPEAMVASCSEAHKGMSHSELIQNFLNSGSCPEIQGYLHLKEMGKKVWKRLYFLLRRSGLYYSTKGTSKDPQHLQYFIDVTESNVFFVTQGKKLYGTPTEYGFCIKPHKTRNGTKGLKVFCTEDEQSRLCWISAFRLFKYGIQLYRNYELSRCSKNSWIGSPSLRSVSDNTLVAMDFSGCTGRVIDNPNEALSAALEEAQAWRKKTSHRNSLPSPCQAAVLSTAIHRTQAWYHGRLSREETHRLIVQQGLVDGVFLVRESQRNPKGFVLSLCHLQKIKHYLILPQCEEDGRPYFTMDDGQTKFTDLIQLVDFHQINKGILPCKLQHFCTSVVL
ncbi:growth factor receptor-bound protein 7 isoform X4 [Microcaecilia unicolor]|uniref:Growth factor receptor-bound protein 7 isoform X4 n=1 Tax=Microcaecilia unicolor TaxID=1415580 RepID=A0A6P7ZV12_9AMPH|nr:growth factor receptor-bound protein 7 isoform X4 [Microcaecilia unicolor]